MTPEIWIMLGTVALTAVLLAALPWLSRPEFLFAVTVGPEFRKSGDGRRVVARYVAEVAAHSVVALALTWLSAQRGGPGLMLLGVLWLVIGTAIALVRGHGAVMPHRLAPSRSRQADLTPRRGSSVAVAVAALLPLLFFAELAVYAHFNWDHVPDRITVHWGLNGPDRWLDKSPRAVYGFIGLLAAASLSLSVAGWGILRGTRRIALGRSGFRYERTFKKAGAVMLLTIAYIMLVPVWLTLRPVTGNPDSEWLMNIWGGVTVAISVGVVAWMIYVGQGGNRAARRAAVAEPEELPFGDRTPDECWKWGLFYFNPGDPAIFVEKRFGVGYTINMGNVWGWVVMALMLSPLAFLWVLR